MKDTYSKRQYLCKCERVTEDYVWKSELKDHTTRCFRCGETLDFKNLQTQEAVEATAIRTPTKNR